MMHVACAANTAYMPHVAAMLFSLLSRHECDEISVHFLHDEFLEEDALQDLRQFVVDLGGIWAGHKVSTELRDRFPDNSHFGREAWYRTLLPEFLPHASRILYLDADTIVRRSIRPLWETDLQGSVVGAIVNPMYGFLDTSFMADLGVTSIDDYFNSGVILFDLDEWRRQNVSSQLFAFVRERGSQQAWPDQNTLNSVLSGRWHKLGLEWNMQNVYFDLRVAKIPYSEKQVLVAREDPAIVHYSVPYKPWVYMCKHPFQKDYLDSLAQTPWCNRPLEGVSLRNRLLRLLPQPYMWIFWVRLRLLFSGVRRRLFRPA